jgi:phage portal protein BeeE
MKADDAQFLESRKLNRSEIAGIYRVPPHFIGDLDRATFSNIEQQSIDYVQKGLLPRIRRVEARMKRSLIPEAIAVRSTSSTSSTDCCAATSKRGNAAIRPPCSRGG